MVSTSDVELGVDVRLVVEDSSSSSSSSTLLVEVILLVSLDVDSLEVKLLLVMGGLLLLSVDSKVVVLGSELILRGDIELLLDGWEHPPLL